MTRVLAALRSRLAQNALALYAAYAANFVLPLLTVPYLAHVLGPSGWGMVAFAQAFGLYGILLVEFGFNISATRAVARLGADREALSTMFADVLGARLALAGLVLGATVAARWLAPVFREQPELAWWSATWAIAQALRPYWYFQGLERLRVVASLDVVTRLLATLGIFACVRQADQGWRVLALQAVAAALTTLVAFALAYRDLRWRAPQPRAAWRMVRESSAVFAYRGAVSLYSFSNTLLLGIIAPPAAVGYYAGADRIMRALLGGLDPLTQALYPRFSQLALTSRARAARLARLVCGVMGAAGAAMTLALLVAAPRLIPLALGQSFTPAVTTLRILALLPLLIGLSTPLGYQWMLPLGMERLLVGVTLATGVVNVLGALLLAPRFAQNGMALALVGAETFALVAILTVLHLRGASPLTTARERLAQLGEPAA